jgi:GNAT superfamily N-acetyltransferase
MRIAFRPAQTQDFAYCRRLYFAQLETVTQEQDSSFHGRWELPEVRMITVDGADVGWLQSPIQDDSLFLVQLFLEARFQGQGIGTETLQRLMDEAARTGVPITLGVVKSNPARRLYKRLGFKTTHEDDRKFYMKYEPPAEPTRETPPSSVDPIPGP